MSVSMSRKKSENDFEKEHKSFCSVFVYGVVGKIPAALLLAFILFLWSSSTTIISGSMVHVCVSSRKLNSLYCLTASQPDNFIFPIPSNSSVENSVSSPQHTQTLNISSPNNPLQIFTENSSSFAVHPTPVPVVTDNIDVQLTVISLNSKLSDRYGEEISSHSTKEGSDFMTFANRIFEKGVSKAKIEEIVDARKEVEGQMSVLRSYIPKSRPSSCDGRGIYVYDLPAKFNKDLLSECEQMTAWVDFCEFMTNHGLGKPIPELGNGWFNTHQYALEPIFHSHILKHPCRVDEIEEATLFYVPFYGGLDVLRHHFRNVSDEVKDSLSTELAEWLKTQTPWKRHFGLDHVLVLGKISWDFRRWENVTWGTRLLELDGLQNPVKLLIERQPWEINDVAVPHPTYFHPGSDDDIFSWQENLRKVPRPHLISFAGASRKATDSIRSILIDQCSSNETCKFFDCRDNACVSPAPLVTLFTQSEFCLQPPGDSPTRKSVFDSLVAGCIPVLFDPFTAYYQYPWHLPQDYRKYSVYIDKEEVRMNGVNVVERLVRIPSNERREMRRYIIDELMPRLVYPHPKGKLDKFEDAFSISVNNLIERALSKLP